MKKGSNLLFSILASAAIILPASIMINKSSKLYVSSKATEPTYTLTYDANHRVVDAKIKTSNGNDIWTKANYNCSFTNNGLEFTKYGYVQNLTALNSISSISLNVSSGTYDVSYGYFEPSDIQVPEYYLGTASASQTFDLSAIKPSYFRVQCVSDSGTLASINVNYTCAKTGADANSETYESGLENYKWYSSFNLGSVSWVTDDVAQSDFANSKRALKLTNITKNQTVKFVDVATLANKKLINTNDDTPYLVFDCKSNGPLMGKINPFMFTCDVKDNAAWKTGWQDPTGYYALDQGDGWYRYYWEIKSNGNATNANTRIPLNQINSIGLIFSQTQSSDTYYLVDNVHLDVKPDNVTYEFGKTMNVPTDRQFTISGNETFYFDLKFTSGNRIYIDIGNWTNYFQLLLDNNGNYYYETDTGCHPHTGTYIKTMGNGWLRIYVSTKEMNRCNSAWITWPYDSGKNTISIIQFTASNAGNAADGVGVFKAPVLYSSNCANYAKPNVTFNDVIKLDSFAGVKGYIDYRVMDTTNGENFNFMISDNWSNYFGYFKFNKFGACGASYAGITVAGLNNGFYRISIDFDALTLITRDNKAKPDPVAIDFLFMSKWAATLTIFSNFVQTN